MSTSVNYENQILNAIETVVNNAVDKAGYDKTIKAQILEKTDENIGEYRVRYQDSTFFAYSNNSEINYPKNSLVYVLIPNNDMRQTKTIVGAVEKADFGYEEILEAEDYYDIIGTNVLNNNSEFGLCSYNGSSNIILFDKSNNINLVNFDEQTFKTCLTNRYNILCGGWFKIVLDDIQKNRGNYGINFSLHFKDPLDANHILTKVYTIDVNNMEGNPYNFNDFTRQVAVFDVDTENYIGVEKIDFFVKDFPKTESGHSNDIFLKTPLLYVVEEIPEAVLNGYSVKIITDKGYFNEDDADDSTITLQTIVKRKGKELSDSKNIQYLWFKENNEVYPAMPGFNSYGGSGWECLNDYNILDDSDPTDIQKEYITNQSTLEITKNECQALENNYKVVVLIGENSTTESIITIKNYDYEYNLSIVSDEGTKFYYGNGTPSLTVLINGQENHDFVYKWVAVDENNISTILEETTSDNDVYNAAVADYETLSEAIAAEEVLPNAVKQQLDTYLAVINSFDTKQRVEGNKIYKIQINEIPNYMIYKCSVYDGVNLIGTTSIKLNNYPKIEGEYFLNITNGTQTFNYDSAGISPASTTLEHPIELPPLSFTIVDGKGNVLPDRIVNLCTVEWVYNNDNSLIKVDSYDNKQLFYSLAEKYDITKINTSNIILKVTYETLNLQTQTNFTFVKDGEPGTNGTDVVCRIVPYTLDDDFSEYPVLYYNNNGDYSLNFNPISNYRWFKVQLWKDNQILWEGVNSKKRDNVIVKWSMLGNNYGNNIKDLSHISIVENSGVSDEYFSYSFYFNNIDSQLNENQNVADILKVEIIYKDKKYYTTLPIITVKTEDWTNYKYSLLRNSGFRYVTYTTDGCYPQYENTTPFTLRVTEKINDYIEDISNLSTNTDYKLTYDWEICGSDYYKANNEMVAAWHEDTNLIEGLIENNKAFYTPVEEYNGKNVSNSIRITITQNENVIGTMNIPIHFYLNRYGISTLNDWDGNHIEINENNDSILAPQIGAGKKEEDNSFTGILMGEVLESGKEKSQYGLYGFYQGDKTIELNSENGSAKFGKVGAGQIVLDPTDDTAVLRSGNYVAPTLDEHGNVTQAGAGLEIDLTDPHIIFGSGKFRVDNDGSVHATEYTTIADLEAGNYDIPSSSVENLDTFISTTNSTLEDLQDQIDGNITTWFYAYAPTLENEPASTWTTTILKDDHLGDLFYDTTTGYCYRFMKENGVYSWQQLSDSDISAALAAAQAAQDTADNKRRVFVTTPTPPYDIGDLWTQGSSGDIKRCQTAKTSSQSYSSDDWILASKYTDDTAINNLKPSLVTSTIVEYALNTSATVAPSTGWSTTAPVWEDGKYMWQRTTSTYADGHSSTPTVTCIAGAAGQNAYTVLLTNENQSIAATTTAAIATTITTGVIAYKGATQKATIIGANASATTINTGITGITAIINNNNTTNASVTFTVTTSLTQKTGDITIPITIDGITFNKKFSFSLSMTGATGKGITSIVEYYAKSSTTTAPAKNLFTTEVPTLDATDKYLWNYEKITYTDTTTVDTERKIIGNFSVDGVSISSVINYYLATSASSGVTRSTSGWTTTVQTVTKTNKYLWNYEKITYSNNTDSYTDPCIIGVYGDTGVGISSIVEYYAINNSSTTPPADSSFNTTLVVPTQSNKYLWNYEKITYTDNTTANTSKRVIGNYSSNGTNGISITGVANKYQVSSSNTTAPTTWLDSPPQLTAVNKYLWNYEIVSYSSGNPTETTPCVIGVYGDKGDSITITTNTNQYKLDDNGTTPPSSGWSDNVPSPLTKGKYLWTKTYIKYSDNTENTSYSVTYVATDGNAGRGISSTEIKYVADNQGVTPPADSANWSNNPPSGDTKGKYIWTRTRITYTDGQNPTTSYSVAYKGTDGINGTSVTITSQEIKYGYNNSGTDHSTVPSTRSAQNPGGWDTTIPAVPDGYYLWTRTTVNYSGGTSTVSYNVSYQSEDGQDATQYYTHVMYATNSSGANISSNPSGKTYIGIRVDTTETASTTPGDYTWSKFIGDNGSNGFSLWTTSTAPSNNTYARSDLTGPSALQNPRVGEIIIRSNRYQYTITAVSGSTITVGTAVDLRGQDGTNGTSIVWKGDLSSAPANPQNLWAYYNTTDKKSYIYNGSSWTTMTIDGTNGTNATQYYYHVVYCNNTSTGAGYATTPSNQIYTGTYTDTNVADAASWSALPSGVKWNYTKGDTGAAGTDATNIVCGNEAQVLVCDAGGQVIAATTITIPFAGYIGANRAACSVTYSTLPSGISLSSNTAATTSADGSLVLAVAANANLGNVTNGVITLTFSCNSKNFVKTFAWSKAIKGAAGENAKLIDISASSQTFKSTDGGTSFTPDNIVLTPRLQNVTYNKWYYILDGGTPQQVTSGQHGLTLNNSILTISKSSDLYTASRTSVVFKCEATDTNVYDLMTILKMQDGINGTNGTSPYFVYLTNEAQTFMYGTAKDITTDLYAYQGTTEKTVQIKTVNGVTASTSTTATGKTGMNFKVSSTSAVNHPTITFSSTSNLAQSQTEQIAIVFRVTGENSDRTLYFSYSSTTQGATGATGTGVSSITEQYYLSTSKTTQTGGEWKDNYSEIGTWTPGKYVWTRSKIIYTNPSSTVYTTAQCSTEWEAVNDIQVGGRNYLYNTATFDSWAFVPSNGGTKTTEDGYTVINSSASGLSTNAIKSFYSANRVLKSLIDDKKITLSFDFKVDSYSDWDVKNPFIMEGNITDNTTRIGYKDVDLNSCQVSNTADLENGKWVRVSYTFDPSGSYFNYSSGYSWADVVYLNIRLTLFRNGSVHYRKVKLEIGNKSTDWTAAPEDTDAEFSSMTTYVNGIRDNLQSQIDGAIQFWNGSAIPTLNNYPASQWTTEADKINHQADIYTVIQDVSGELKQGKSYRFDKVNNVWQWIELTDNELSAVQALAASKAKVFVVQPTVPYNVGDLWLKDGDLYKCKTAKGASGSYSLSDWELATDYTDDSAAQAVQVNLDNLKIGARNLVIKSNIEKTSKNTITTYDISSYGITECVGKTVTISFDIKADTDNVQCDCYLRSSVSSIISDTQYTITGVTTSYKRYTTIKDVSSTQANPIKWFALRTTQGSITATFSIKNIKVEIGNRATDWSPAPEDAPKTLDVEYYLSDYFDSLSGGSWSTTAPTWVDGKYMWSRQKLTYGDGSYEYKNQTCIAGAKGESAKLVSITPSSQVFKSTEGAEGTFNPQYIYLYPDFQACTYSKWQYSTNGTSWTDVSSGTHSLTIGTYNSIANSLRIERTCDLYTSSITSLSFKCVSNVGTAYDIVSVIKVYDVTDLEIGGRNYILNSNFQYAITYWNTLGYSTSGSNANINIVTNNKKKWLYVVGDGTTNFQGLSQNQYSNTEDDKINIKIEPNKSYVFTARAKSTNNNTSIKVKFQWFNGTTSISTNETTFTVGTTEQIISKVYTTPANTNNFTISVGIQPSSGQTPNFYMTELQFERGKTQTDWVSAIEDTYSTTNALDTNVQNILNAIQSGYVSIKNGNILVADKENSPENVIIINNQGIGFFKGSDWPTDQEIASATSAWSINGDLNMNYIHGGSLKVGGSENNQNGTIEIYDNLNQKISSLNNEGISFGYANEFNSIMNDTGTYFKNGNVVVGQYTKDGSKQKDLEVFGTYYYGKNEMNETAMFIGQLYTDNNGEECFGHFYNRGD